jgi:hypothetical protein
LKIGGDLKDFLANSRSHAAEDNVVKRSDAVPIENPEQASRLKPELDGPPRTRVSIGDARDGEMAGS